MRKRFFFAPRARRYAIGLAGAMLLADFALSLGSPTGLRAPRVEVATLRAATSGDRRPAFTSAAKARVEQRKQERAKTPPPNLTRVENDLCRIGKETSIPIDGELRQQYVERPDGARSYWLKSSNCPDELYSIVHIDREGRIDKEINCQNTSLTEVTLNSGLQFTIMNVVPSADVLALAIAGNGRLLVNCPDTGLTITRDGFFDRRSGLLKNAEGCVAWTRKDGGRPVKLSYDEHVDEKGCASSGRECFEVLEPDESDVEAFNFKTKNSLAVLNARGLRSVREPHVYENSTEDLDSADRSLTGVANWETILPTALPPRCP